MLIINNNINIIIYGGIIMYSLFLIIQFYIYKNRNIIEIQINNSILNKSNVNIMFSFYFSFNLLIIICINHFLYKIGIYNMILYNINIWLFFIGINLFIIPFILFGSSLFFFIFSFFYYNINNGFNKYNIILIQFFNNNFNLFIFLLDLYFLFIFINNIYKILNWLYIIIYYSFRMFFVFILHSFSNFSFSELFSYFTNNHFLFNFFFIGFSVISFIIISIDIFYISIQIFVFINFIFTFFITTIFLFFYIIPISFIDIFHFNSFFFIIISFLFLILLFTFLLFFFNFNYLVIYSNINLFYTPNEEFLKEIKMHYYAILGLLKGIRKMDREDLADDHSLRREILKAVHNLRIILEKYYKNNKI